MLKKSSNSFILIIFSLFQASNAISHSFLLLVIMGLAIACDNIFFAFAVFRQENIPTNEKFFPNFLSLCLSWKTYLVACSINFTFFSRIRVLFYSHENQTKNSRRTIFLPTLHVSAKKSSHDESIMKSKQDKCNFAVLLFVEM